MRLSLRPLRRPALLLGITVTSLLVTFGALWMFGGNLPGGSAQLGEPVGRGGRWGSLERDRLAVCIDTVNVAASAGVLAKTETEDILAELASDPLWPQFNKDFPAPLVNEGCPSPPVLYDPKAHRPDPFPDTFAYLRPRVISDASYYYLHVYVIPQEDIDRYGPDWRFTSEESFCKGDSCTPVTGGLYVSTKDLEDRQLLTNLVAKAIGLRGTRP